MSLSFLTPEQRDLLRGADIPALLPHDLDPTRVRVGAQTTLRAGSRRLVALEVRIAEDERSPTPRLELLMLVRAALMASIPEAERNELDDAVFMRDYLRREAMSGLALRTLELGDGVAYGLTTPLDELISARQADLPEPHAADLRVDGVRTAASRIAFGAHAATWADLPGAHAAVVVYGSAEAPVPELVVSRP